jgi:hypothetical protein
MTNKFFLFNKEKVNTGSTSESDTGVGISVIALQSSNLAYMTASQGKVTMVFNDSGIYDFVQTVEGEAYRKTTIDVECEIGQEQSLIEDILNFIANAPPNRNVMVFDYTGKSSFKQATVKTPKSIESKVYTSPELMKPKELLLGDTGLTAFNIDGIEFTELSYPIVDYSPIGIPTGTSGVTGVTAGVGLTYLPSGVSSWKNNSLLPNSAGPTGYNLNGFALDAFPPHRANPGIASNTGVGVTSAFFSNGRALEIPVPIDVQEDYTTYICFGIPDDDTAASSIVARTNYKSFGSFYGSSDYKGVASFDISAPSLFVTRHFGQAGAPAGGTTDTDENGTVPYKVPDNRGVGIQQTCYVFVVRRDKNYNIYLHDHEGDLVCVIPSKTIESGSISGRTDGVFNFYTLGYGSITGDSNQSRIDDWFWGFMVRFGVIQRDIGPSEASRLARALYEKYKPLK